jgi:signal transduction histidine kinase
MSEELNDEFQREWLESSKQSVEFGIRRFAVPLCLLFWIVDIQYLPTKFWWALLIRSLSIPLSYLGLKYLNLSKNHSQLLRRYSLQVFSYTLMIYVLNFMSADPQHLYFLGLPVVAVGAFAFISLPRKVFVLFSLVIFFPFFAYTLLTGMATSNPTYFWLYLLNTIALLVIFYYSNENLMRFQRKEFESRMALNQLLKQRDDEISNLISEVSTLKMKQAEFIKKEEAFKLARQVAHDIRAPISALNVATRKLKDTSSELAEFIEASSKRINDIADTMLNKSRQELTDQNSLYSFDLVKIIRTIVDEKKATTSVKHAAKEIEFDVDLPQMPIRARVFESDFSRALSNLLENSIDAISSRGVVKIKCALDSSKNQVLIEIRDNGRGIPQEILANVGRYGFSFGKSSGSGLGVAFAFNVMKSAGGDIRIQSEPEKFTSIQLNLPLLDTM